MVHAALVGCSAADDSINLWTLSTSVNPDHLGLSKLSDTLKGHTGTVASISYLAGRGVLATASFDRTIKLWRLRTEATGEAKHTAALQATLTGHTDGINGIVYLADKGVIASTGDDNTLRLWALSDDGCSGNLSATLQLPSDSGMSLEYIANGKDVLAVGSYDTTITLWQLSADGLSASLASTLTTGAHSRAVYSMAYLQTENVLASGGGDHVINLWTLAADGRSAVLSKTLTGHTDAVTSLVYGLVSCCLGMYF